MVFVFACLFGVGLWTIWLQVKSGIASIGSSRATREERAARFWFLILYQLFFLLLAMFLGIKITQWTFAK
jgi:hypothetical protein